MLAALWCIRPFLGNTLEMALAIISIIQVTSMYSKRKLNFLIDDGANFTISTMRTPASLQKVLEGIHLKLPIIAMDGVVLYDMNTRGLV